MTAMTLKSFAVAAFIWAYFLATASLAPGAETARLAENDKIEALIKHVANGRDIKFVRNGKTYDSSTAALFLSRKWAANASAVKTARDFIDRIASFSGTSAAPYLIRFRDGTEIESRDFLLLKLKTLEVFSKPAGEAK